MREIRKVVTIFAFILAIPTIAFGGQEVGNGGDALVCESRGREPVEMLDTYVARERLGLHPGLPGIPDGISYRDLVAKVLDRLSTVNPTRTQKYRIWLQTFFEEAEILPDLDLVNIPDEGPQVIPRGCSVKQIAVQRSDGQIMPGEKRYTISKELWDRMSAFNKAVLVVHELAYREKLNPDNFEGNVIDSRHVRHFTAHVISSEVISTDFQMLAVVDWLDSYDAFGSSVQVSAKNSSGTLFINFYPTERSGYATSLASTGMKIFANRRCDWVTLIASTPMTWPLNLEHVSVGDCTGAPFSAVIEVGSSKFTASLDAAKSPEAFYWSKDKDSMDGGEAFAGYLTNDLRIPNISFSCSKGGRLMLRSTKNTLQCDGGAEFAVDSIFFSK